MQPLDKLVQQVIARYQEHFTLVLEDLRSRSGNKTLLVEGTALLPRQVSQVLARRHQAIWMATRQHMQFV